MPKKLLEVSYCGLSKHPTIHSSLARGKVDKVLRAKNVLGIYSRKFITIHSTEPEKLVNTKMKILEIIIKLQ